MLTLAHVLVLQHLLLVPLVFLLTPQLQVPTNTNTPIYEANRSAAYENINDSHLFYEKNFAPKSIIDRAVEIDALLYTKCTGVNDIVTCFQDIVNSFGFATRIFRTEIELKELYTPSDSDRLKPLAKPTISTALLQATYRAKRAEGKTTTVLLHEAPLLYASGYSYAGDTILKKRKLYKNGRKLQPSSFSLTYATLEYYFASRNLVNNIVVLTVYNPSQTQQIKNIEENILETNYISTLVSGTRTASQIVQHYIKEYFIKGTNIAEIGGGLESLLYTVSIHALDYIPQWSLDNITVVKLQDIEREKYIKTIPYEYPKNEVLTYTTHSRYSRLSNNNIGAIVANGASSIVLPNTPLFIPECNSNCNRNKFLVDIIQEYTSQYKIKSIVELWYASIIYISKYYLYRKTYDVVQYTSTGIRTQITLFWSFPYGFHNDFLGCGSRDGLSQHRLWNITTKQCNNLLDTSYNFNRIINTEIDKNIQQIPEYKTTRSIVDIIYLLLDRLQKNNGRLERQTHFYQLQNRNNYRDQTIMYLMPSLILYLLPQIYNLYTLFTSQYRYNNKFNIKIYDIGGIIFVYTGLWLILQIIIIIIPYIFMRNLILYSTTITILPQIFYFIQIIFLIISIIYFSYCQPKFIKQQLSDKEKNIYDTKTILQLFHFSITLYIVQFSVIGSLYSISLIYFIIPVLFLCTLHPLNMYEINEIDSNRFLYYIQQIQHAIITIVLHSLPIQLKLYQYIIGPFKDEFLLPCMESSLLQSLRCFLWIPYGDISDIVSPVQFWFFLHTFCYAWCFSVFAHHLQSAFRII